MTAGRDGQIITFYSQKGGTGRTMAVANTAWILASNGYRVLASDWDIEAPGLHRYFHPFLDAATSGATTGVLNLFAEYVADWHTSTESEADLRQRHARVLPHAVSINWVFPSGGTLDYMPAGRQDGEYLTHLMDFSWREFTDLFGGTRFLDALRHDMKSRYDYTLIDSRCGVSDLVGLCTIDLPDVLVNCFTLSSQSIEGAAVMARSIAREAHPRSLRVLPVAMRVGDGRGTRLAAARELVRSSFPRLPAVWAGMEIPHQPEYAYEETLATFGDPPDSPNSLLTAFEQLTDRITEGRVRRFPALDDDLRRRHLALYVRPMSPVATPLRLSHAPQDRMWAEWINSLLTHSGFEVLAPAVGATPSTPGRAPRTVALLSSSFLRSPQSRTLWESVGDADPGAPRQLIPFRIESVTLTAPFSDYDPVDLTSLDEPRTAEAVLRSLGLPGETISRPLAPARPRFPGHAPAVWEAPPRNPLFVGRDRLLDRLHATLDVSRQRAVVLPRDGLGAAGRTQLAVEYSYRFQAAYDLVWWIRAESRESVLLSLAQLADRLGVRNGTGVPEAARRALDALDRGTPHGRWLLIYGNARSPESLSGLLPASMHGHVLVTSRDRGWSAAMDTVEVGAFTREQSIELLRRRVPALTVDDADRIAAAVEDMPLAVAQAGSWLTQTTASAEQYLQKLAEQSGASTAPPSDGRAHPTAALSTRVALATLGERAPAALRLLALCSHLAPLPVPLPMVHSEAALRVLRLHDGTLHEPMLLGRVVQEISRLGLAEVDQPGHTLKVHPVVQSLVLAALPAHEVDEVRHEAHQLLSAAGPRRDGSGTEADDRAFEKLWPHLDHSGAEECRDDDTRAILIERLRRTAQCGMPEQALELGRRLDRSWTHGGRGADHQVLLLRSHQAAALRDLGSYAEAYDLDSDTLRRQRMLLPAGHAHTLMTAAGLAEDLRMLGRFAEALELAREVSAGFQESFGEEHPQALTTSEALARSLRLVGDYAAARERSLATWQRQREVLGHGHPSALVSALGLARDLREVGDYGGSVPVLRSALKETRGQDTQGALRATVSLSVSLRRMGEWDEAHALALTADKGYRAAGEGDDPDRLACEINLALATARAGDLPGARTALSTLQHRFAQVCGAEHPDTAVCEHNLAVCLRAAGETDKALAAAGRTVQSLGEHLGDAHPYTLCGMLTLANALGDLEQFGKAEHLSRTCAKALRDRVGDNHPDTLIADLGLAVTLHSLGRTVEAGRLRNRALATFAKRFGDGHAWTVAARGWQRIDRDLEPLLPA
ncbi:FxSxx-COOH system tetratricopeptide repeat protein [Streptomyces sp. NPDC001401]|uniref:FxSxx-COOH system tetratricopeptide repeat protein n=1 Tax=Streptomyces sp. NPDC001401 TaxID=3364570 RepID=UPI0036BC20A6